MNRASPLVLAALVSLAGSAPAWASDLPSPAEAGYAKAGWPQYKRDAARTGDAADEALKFPLRRALAVKFPSPIYASAAVVGGKVYAVDQRGLLACIDAAAGRVLWHARIGGVSNRSSPAVAGGKVFVGSTAGHLMVLDAASGRELTRIPAEGGVIAAPAVANDAVYFCSFNARLTKLDLSGKVIWAYDGGKSCPREIVVDGRKIAMWAGPLDGDKGTDLKMTNVGLHVVEDLGDRCVATVIRRRDWEADPKKFDKILTPRVVVSPPRDYYRGFEIGPTRRGGTHLVTRFLDGLVCVSSNGWEAGRNWKAGDDAGGPPGSLSQPVIVGEHVAVGGANGRIYFYKLAADREFQSTGKPAWTYDTSRMDKPNGGVSATPAVSGGVVYVGGEDGILYGLGPGPGSDAAVVPVLPESKPEQLPGERLKGPEWATIGGDMSYCAISPDTQLKPPLKILWKTHIAGLGGQNSVVVAAGKVFAASCDGPLEALDAETGEILWRSRHPYVQHVGGGTNANNSPPTYAEGKVLVLRRGAASFDRAARNAGLWCHDARTGELLWHRTTPVPYPNMAGCSQGEGVVVHDGKVLIAWHEAGNAVETAALDLGTGKELWRVRHEGVLPAIPAEAKPKSLIRVAQGALGDGTWFLSASALDQRNWGTVIGGATLAVNPADGKLVWKNAERFSTWASGLNYRNGTVVVYHEWRAGHALDARTGRHLWSSGGGKGAGPWLFQPLTDEYLDSQGRKGAVGGYCTDPVWVNGVYYGQLGPTSKVLWARGPDGKELWRFVPTSSACPTAAPAYGRLYYCAWGEGVVYCFVNRE